MKAPTDEDGRREGYSYSQQIRIWLFVCIFVLTSFLPFMLGMNMYDDEPDVPYNGAVDDTRVEVANAVIVGCTALMTVEAFLDSKTLYIPIKIAFPRFVTVVGVLLVSILPYLIDVGHGMDKLNFHACSTFAKGYCIVGGLGVQLLHDAAPIKNTYTIRFYMYSSAVVLFTANYELHLWNSYVDSSHSYQLAMNIVGLLSLLVAIYFVFRSIELALKKDHDGFFGLHYYDLMSHVIVSAFFFGTYAVVIFSSAETWKDYTHRELLAYQYIDLVIIAMFFFTSSYIAQQNFVADRSELKTKKYFVRYISHEIRTPLNTVYMGIQLLRTELKKSFASKKREDVELTQYKNSCESIVHDINESVCIALNILNDLLLIDKIEEGTIKLDMQSINAYDLFHSYIHHFNIQAQFSKISLSIDLKPLRRVVVVVDEMKIAQVIRNAVSNALKFTPRGGHVQVKAQFIPAINASDKSDKSNALRMFSSVQTTPLDTGIIRVEILDTGPGISEDDKAKLFKNVIQFNPNELQNGGGSGLGLYISSAIMKRHSKGCIGVMSGGVEQVDSKTLSNSNSSEGDVELGESRSSGFELVPSETATGGSVFYIELAGHKIMDDEILHVSSPPSERYSCSVSNTPGRKSSGHLIERSESMEGSTSGRGDTSSNYESHNAIHESSPVVEMIASSSFRSKKFMFRKALVVEDSKFNRKMMQKLLSSYAEEVVTAEDGVEGVEAVRQCGLKNTEQFDLIFMDSLMPNMNGITATKKIIGEFQFSNPIIAITGNMLPEDVREFEDAGAYTVLGKPLRLEKLDEVLNFIHDARVDCHEIDSDSARELSRLHVVESISEEC